MNTHTRKLCISAAAGALYAALTLLLAPISYGAIQCRLSEAVCILPYFFPETAWGLFIGCAAANLFSGNIFDVVFGSLATLAAGICTARLGKAKKPFLACTMPVVINSLTVGAVITFCYQNVASVGVFAVNVLWIAAGEALAMYAVGLPLLYLLKKTGKFISGKENFYAAR